MDRTKGDVLMALRFFKSCSSCNRPPLADWLVASAMIFVFVIVCLMAWFVLSAMLG